MFDSGLLEKLDVVGFKNEDDKGEKSCEDDRRKQTLVHAKSYGESVGEREVGCRIAVCLHAEVEEYNHDGKIEHPYGKVYSTATGLEDEVLQNSYKAETKPCVKPPQPC